MKDLTDNEFKVLNVFYNNPEINWSTYNPQQYGGALLTIEGQEVKRIIDKLSSMALVRQTDSRRTNQQGTFDKYVITDTGKKFYKDEKDLRDAEQKLKDRDEEMKSLSYEILQVDKELKNIDRWWKKYWWIPSLITFIIGLITPMLLQVLLQVVPSSNKEKIEIIFPKSEQKTPIRLDTVRVSVTH